MGACVVVCACVCVCVSARVYVYMCSITRQMLSIVGLA